MNVDLSIIIVNWNTSGLLASCLESLIASGLVLTDADHGESVTGKTPGIEITLGSPHPSAETPREVAPGVEVYVVDNGSTDNSAEMVRARFPWVHVLENQTNVGFARANNQAIAKSTGQYVLLLNSDTVVLPGALQKLLACMESMPNAGACGPMLLNSDLSYQAGFADFPTLFTELIHQAGLAPYLLSPSYPSYSFEKSQQQRTVDWVGGACLLVRRAAIDQVGLLDESFFMYAEEVDWCYRMKRAGWQILYCPDAQVIHLGGKSSIATPVWKYVQLQRSQVHFFAKHYGFIHARLLALLIRGLCAVKAGFVSLVNRESPHNIQRRKAYWAAVRASL